MKKFQIFLSHTYEERKLADAFKWLIETVSNNEISAWYSSDPRPSGGVELGNWRKQVHKRLVDTNEVIAIITPESNDMSWIAYETGFSRGLKKITTPLYYFMTRRQMKFFDSNISAFKGNDRSEIIGILSELFKKAGIKVTEDMSEHVWPGLINVYMKRISDQEEALRGRQLFQDHFHDARLSEDMEEITWYAAWTKVLDNNDEMKWSKDQLKCWSTDNRIRFVGEAETTIYPMEGVRSKRGVIAMSYWSEGTIPICGTVMMQSNLEGSTYIGTWSGHTSQSLQSGLLEFVRGNVFMTKSEEERDEWYEKRTSSELD
ncbi:MAG: hypothetical protein AAF489_11265 [Bacteroidota bacterium]